MACRWAGVTVAGATAACLPPLARVPWGTCTDGEVAARPDHCSAARDPCAAGQADGACGSSIASGSSQA